MALAVLCSLGIDDVVHVVGGERPRPLCGSCLMEKGYVSSISIASLRRVVFNNSLVGGGEEAFNLTC